MLPLKEEAQYTDEEYGGLFTRRECMFDNVSPLLRKRSLRILLVAAPGLMAAVGILTAASESNLALVLLLNAAAGVIASSLLFIAVIRAASQVAEERVGLARAVEQGFWRARVQNVLIQHEESGLYTDWYFRLRLREEIERSRRYNKQFALVLINPSGLHESLEVQTATEWFGDNIRQQLRGTDLPAVLQDGSLAIIMPHTARRAAKTAEHRITNALQLVEPRIGLAIFPKDGDDGDALLAAAVGSALSAATSSPASTSSPRSPATAEEAKPVAISSAG